MVSVYKVPPAAPHTSAIGHTSTGQAGTAKPVADARTNRPTSHSIKRCRPRAGSVKRSASMPAGMANTMPPMPLTDNSKAAAPAAKPRLSPYSGNTEPNPISKNPPIKPASITTGWATTACHKPRKPTLALAASCAAGVRGIKKVQQRPRTSMARTANKACGLSTPNQATNAGPITMVRPIRVA